MSFKYINPGFNIGDFATMTQYNAKSGESSSGTKLAETAIFYLPTTTKIIFLSLTCTWGRLWRALAYNDNGVKETGIYFDNYVGTLRLNNTTNTKTNPMPRGVANWYIKIFSDAQAGEFAIYRDGIQIFAYTGNVMDGDDIAKIDFYAKSSTDDYLANIIISDEYFPPSEKIIALPVANTTATMADNGDGSYTADEVGETVMQTIDAAKLTQIIGEGNTLTGFSLIGNPAYYDGTELTHLGAMKGETVKESVALPTNTDGKILASWSDNVKQADIANLSLGWKAQV